MSCGFPAGTPVTVSDDARLPDFGLLDTPETRNARGRLYITIDPIDPSGAEPPGRWYCIEYPEPNRLGLSMIHGPVPEGWTPPDE